MRATATGWAVFAPSGAVSWRSLETSREASLRAFAGEHWAEIDLARQRGGWLPLRSHSNRRKVEWVTTGQAWYLVST